ncbi:MAG: RNA methyltransferase [Thermomicrobiales bacterium]|nr:RNA methyltransferase [Thermomicrobiales bacterium]
MTDLISSTANPLVKRIRALTDKRARKREGAFVVEGHQPVWRAVQGCWEIDTLIVAPDLVRNPAAFEMIEDLSAAGVRVAYLSSDLFARISERDGPAGIMAIVQQQQRSLASVSVTRDQTWVILHRVHNPGNLGTSIRTADAAGIAGIVLCGDCADIYDPVAVKASMGSIFAVPVIIEREFDTVRAWVTEQGIQLVGTSGYAEASHWDFDWNAPQAIVLGNEGDGLPDEVLNDCDSTVRIPMTGTVESLNLGVAAAILMYESRRQRFN